MPYRLWSANTFFLAAVTTPAALFAVTMIEAGYVQFKDISETDMDQEGLPPQLSSFHKRVLLRRIMHSFHPNKAFDDDAQVFRMRFEEIVKL